jgi:hypothetical protein
MKWFDLESFWRLNCISGGELFPLAVGCFYFEDEIN